MMLLVDRKVLYKVTAHALLISTAFLATAPYHFTGSVAGFILNKFLVLILFLAPAYINHYLILPILFQRNKWLYWGILFHLLLLFTFLSYLNFQWMDPHYVPVYIKENYPVRSLLLIFARMALITGGAIFFRLIRMSYTEKQKTFEADRTRLESELEFLKLQISPHFFFNIMNTIYHSIRLDPKLAEDVVINLSEMMQYHIYDCSREKVTLDKELKNINNYIALQKMRLSAEPEIIFAVQGDIQGKFIAPFILITFVENAFNRSLINQLKPSSFTIDLMVERDELIFRVTNANSADSNQPFFPDDEDLKNIRQRLNLLYPLVHSLRVIQDNHYEGVQLNLQLN